MDRNIRYFVSLEHAGLHLFMQTWQPRGAAGLDEARRLARWSCPFSTTRSFSTFHGEQRAARARACTQAVERLEMHIDLISLT